MPHPKLTEASIKRAINAWLACGLTVGSVSVSQDGSIKIEAPAANSPKPPGKTPEPW